MEVATLMWGMIFGSIGMGYFIYGKRQRAVVPMVCGLTLMVYPYFLGSWLAIIMIGIALMAVPYFVRV
ncbi:MAG: hypothetical protein ACREO3_09370 [Arenimonas sp.]